ncbi:hypothetical protein H6F89_28920 [Cyanobacteria bacterium FACHB-63]|nr:hypothetical protein [Cyanobacteria bacterium FACHB-63]
MKKLGLTTGLLIVLTGGIAQASPDIVYPKRESYPSENTIGLASESPSKHSRAWISNISNDEMQRVAGTYQLVGKNLAFAVAFQFGNHERCLYIDNGDALLKFRTYCHAWYSREDRLGWVSVQLPSGNTMVIRYDPRTSTQETMRFLNLWESLYGSD